MNSIGKVLHQDVAQGGRFEAVHNDRQVWDC